MRNIFTLLMLASVLVFTGCGASNKENDALAKKKQELDKLKQEKTGLDDRITKLEKEIAAVDTSLAKTLNTKLVALTEIAPSNFTHYIDLQGRVSSQDVVFVSPRGQAGQVTALNVKRGDQVRKGQLLLRLNDDVTRRQIDQQRVQIDYLKDILSRREKLWSQNIGAEVDLITARNNVENAEKQLQILQQQSDFSNVYAPISGVAEEVNIRVGEVFQGGGQISIVNNTDLKVQANVPENYIDKVKLGTPVQVTFPDLGKTVNSKLSVSGKLIDPTSRGFQVEAKLPFDRDFRPNQTAVLKIQDYTTSNAVAIPLNTLQTDEKGKFVLVAITENGKLTARKRPVQIGELYGDRLEVKSGLQSGDKLITEGFQGVYDGQLITTTTNT